MNLIKFLELSKIGFACYLTVFGLLLSFVNVANAMSCIPRQSFVYGQVQMAESQLIFDARIRMADSNLIVQGVVESISEEYASMNWSTAYLASIRPIRTFKGETATKFQVLVPIGTKQADEVVIFANLETGKEVQNRIDWNKAIKKSNLAWTQEKTPLWVASEPCIERTYSSKKFPQIVTALKQVLNTNASADLFITARVYSPGASGQSVSDKTRTILKKTISLVNTDPEVQTTQASRPLKDDGDGSDFLNTSIDGISEGRYAVLAPKLRGMNTACTIDYREVDCASIELKSYAIHRLNIDYRPSAKINLIQIPVISKYTPIEYEFIALHAQKARSSKISYVHGIHGELLFLAPSNYNIFAVINGGAPSHLRRFQITQNGNRVFNFNEGLNEISVNTSEFTEPVETKVKWQLPSGATKSVSTSFRLLTTTNGLDSYYQSAQSSCTNDICTITAMRGQSIELSASIYGVDYRTEFSTNKTIRIGDQTTVNLTLTPVTK